MEWYESVGSGDINTTNYFDSYEPSANPIFPSPSFLPNGATDLDSRSNSSFWDFDQSAVKNTIGNVIGSDFGKAIAKTGVQLAADSINKNANQPGLLGQFSRNFRSTATGQQINAGSIATQFQNFLANPMVWFAAVAGVVLIFVLRR